MRLLNETWFYMLIGVVSGLLFPVNLKFLLYPILFTILCFSLTRLKIHSLSKHEKKSVGWLVLISYLVGALIIALTLLLIKNSEFQKGLFIIAVMPPAVAIIPWTTIFKGNLREAMAAEVISYFLAIIIVPLCIYLITKEFVSVMTIAKDLILLLFIPFILSRWLRKHHIAKHSQLFINILFLVMFYIIISVNRDSLTDIAGLSNLIILTLISVFVVPTIAFFAIKNRHERPDFVLFSALKNGSLSVVITLAVLSPAASVPATVRAIAGVFFFMYMEWLFKKYKK